MCPSGCNVPGGIDPFRPGWPKTWGPSALSASSFAGNSQSRNKGSREGVWAEWGLTVHLYPYPRPAAGKYKESHLVLANCPQHLERSAEGLSFDISMVQKYMRATGHSSIQGVTGHRGGVGMSRDLRHRILASTSLGSSHKPMSSCISEAPTLSVS